MRENLTLACETSSPVESKSDGRVQGPSKSVYQYCRKPLDVDSVFITNYKEAGQAGNYIVLIAPLGK